MKKTTTIYQGATVAIAIVNDKYLEITWKGSTKTDEYKESCEKILSSALEFNIRRWLLNQTDMLVHPSDLKWAQDNWLPRVIKEIPDRKVAIVLSKNLFGEYQTKMGAEAIKRQSKTDYRYYKSLDEARDWFDSDL